ncbi:hypothetical protein PR048_014381 [Dryococelus australis]|uniref:Integrase catalytic domain-containing protein n=1 Tax=Dryococelus australis TaxID=614101 RepID=A0ABQ9HE07_9NEOP|nr:hypothetical protein PR048_014381 [Dryococelus australis]
MCCYGNNEGSVMRTAQDLFFTVDISEEESKKYGGVVKCLESYFIPCTNQSVERHTLNNHVQEDSESIDTFVTALRCLSTNCGYESLCDDLTKDRIVCGVRDTRMKYRLLREPTLNLAKAVQICKAAERTHELMQAIDRKEAVALHVIVEDTSMGLHTARQEEITKRGRFTTQTRPIPINGDCQNKPCTISSRNKTPQEFNSKKDSYTRVFSTLLQDIEGVQIYIDGIIVFGKDEIEHDRMLERVLQRATDNNVTFNQDKCRFRLKEVKYIGYIIGKEGIKVDSGKVHAITEFPEPENVCELQRFLGMTTYVDQFDNTAVLRALCKREKELLAVVYGFEHVHQYIYGHKVLVESDHKPLEAIFSKPLDRCPLRLQCMRIKLQNYDMLICVPGKELVIPDALSRASGPDTELELQEHDFADQQVTQNDKTLNHLKTITMNGWPNSLQQVPACVKPDSSFRDELTVHDELVYKGTQIVVPKSMRCTILSKIHYNDMGVQKSKLRARESQGNDYLLMFDAYSKYPEFSHLTNLSSTQLVTHCKTIMARHGIPETLHNDNEPQFSSREFKGFARLWGINHKTSSPGYPLSNGLAERHVQAIKRMVKKAIEYRKDIMLVLLEYRNTPIVNTLQSPAQLLFSRCPRGLLHCTASRLIPQAQLSLKRDLETRQQKQKHYYDRQSRRAEIVTVLERPKSYRVRVDTGYEVEMNRRYIITDTSHQPFVISGDLEEQEGNSQEIDNTEPITSANEKWQTTFNTKDGRTKGFEALSGMSHFILRSVKEDSRLRAAQRNWEHQQTWPPPTPIILHLSHPRPFPFFT